MVSISKRQVWHLAQSQHAWQQGPTAVPQTCPGPRLPAPPQHGAGCVHALSVSPSEPAGWHHQLVVQNHRQLRKADEAPSRKILTPFIFILLKVSTIDYGVCVEKQKEIPSNNDETPSLLCFP